MHRLLGVSLVAVCIAVACEPAAYGQMVVQACFSPAGRCSEHILHAVNNATEEILVAVYAFTSLSLAQALVRARERGVAVRVILDSAFDAQSHNSVGGFLAAHDVPVARVSGVGSEKQQSGLMHQKFLVVDGVIVAGGSYNWTHSAERLNHESLLIFRHAGPLAREFRAQFLRLWNQRD